MRLLEAARQYRERKSIDIVFVYNVTRFARLIQDIHTEEVDEEKLKEFVAVAKEKKLSPSSIKGTVCAIRTLKRDCGEQVKIPIVRVPPPNPTCFATSTLDAAWPHMPAWCQQHVALTFHTCFRLNDILRLQLAGTTAETDIITLEASKTRHRHAIPVPRWLRQYMKPVEIPWSVVNDWTQEMVRTKLEECCEAAGVHKIMPSQIRKLGLTRWAEANSHASEIVHGCGLQSTMRHYVDKLHILRAAMVKIDVPKCFGAEQDSTEQVMLTNFKRMDPAAQQMMVGMSERLAAG